MDIKNRASGSDRGSSIHKERESSSSTSRGQSHQHQHQHKSSSFKPDKSSISTKILPSHGNHLKGWNEFMASWKPRVPVPIAPVEPYFFIDPIDFEPFIHYEPTNTELEWGLPYPDTPFWTLEEERAERTLIQGGGKNPDKIDVEYDPLPDYVQILLDLEENAKTKKPLPLPSSSSSSSSRIIPNPTKNMTSFIKSHPMKKNKYEEMVLQDYETVMAQLKRNGDVDFLDDPSYPKPEVFAWPKEKEEKKEKEEETEKESKEEEEESKMEWTEEIREEKMEKEEEEPLLPQQAQTKLMMMTHPDHPEWTCVKQWKVKLDEHLGRWLGSVMFEDEHPPEARRLHPHGILKVAADASLPSGTAGLLYLPKGGDQRDDEDGGDDEVKKVKMLKLHREYELETLDQREYDLIALTIVRHKEEDGEGEEEERMIACPIKEAYRVHKRPTMETLISQEQQQQQYDRGSSSDRGEDRMMLVDEELLQELRVKPDLEIELPVMPPLPF